MLQGKISGARTPSFSRRNLLLGAGLLGTAALARAMVPRDPFDMLGKGRLENLVPETLGPWSFATKTGLVIPPQDQLSDALYAQLLTRVYTAQDRLPMMLLIAQSPGQDGVLQIHRPEFCYPAGGFRLSGSRVHEVELPGNFALPTRMFTASSLERTEQLIYWTRIGRDLPTTWADQRLSVAKANFRGEIPDAVMVRISTASSDPAALGQIDEFARALIGGVSAQTRPILIGSNA